MALPGREPHLYSVYAMTLSIFHVDFSYQQMFPYSVEQGHCIWICRHPVGIAQAKPSRQSKCKQECFCIYRDLKLGTHFLHSWVWLLHGNCGHITINSSPFICSNILSNKDLERLHMLLGVEKLLIATANCSLEIMTILCILSFVC